MLIREVMTTAPSTCYATDSANAAARIMWERDCGVVPVVDESGRPVGMITDRDIAMAAYFTGRCLCDISLADVMSHDVCAVSGDTDLADAERLMQDRQVRRLPVVENGSVIGIVSLADIAFGVAGNRNGNGSADGADRRANRANGGDKEFLRTIQRVSEPRRPGELASM